jgi:DNA-binding CsgD family transcriptional regulator/PAS domain-containing protein
MATAPKIATAIEQAYDCMADEDGWDQFLASYARLVGADSGVIYVRTMAAPGTLIASLEYDASTTLAKYLSYYEARSPVFPLFRQLSEAKVRAIGEFAFCADYRRTEYYQDWVRPQGYGDLIGSHLVRTPQLYAWLALRRSERRGTFTRSEVLAAARVAPHVMRAVKFRCRLEQERSNAGSLRGALEALRFGILIVDGGAKVLMANHAAELILRIGDGLQCHHGLLVCARPQETSALHHAIRALMQAGTAADLHVSRNHGSRPLMLHVLPIPSPSEWNGFVPRTGTAAIFVVDPMDSAPNIEAFAAAYVLTGSETRVLREIVTRGGLVQSAQKLNIAATTARTHLQSVFAKTGTRSQTELVQLVMKSSLQLSW